MGDSFLGVGEGDRAGRGGGGGGGVNRRRRQTDFQIKTDHSQQLSKT